MELNYVTVILRIDHDKKTIFTSIVSRYGALFVSALATSSTCYIKRIGLGSTKAICTSGSLEYTTMNARRIVTLIIAW